MELNAKKLIYRTLWIATGVLAATIVVGLIELGLIYSGTTVDWVILMYLLAILLLGLFVGLICGRIAWKKIYVDGVRGIKYTIDHNERVKAFEGDLLKNLKGFDIDRAMKWTVTIFLLFLMVIISVWIAFSAVNYVRTGASGDDTAVTQLSE